MTYGQAALLGAVQGATEFLPVSSSAHLALAPRLLRFEDPGLTFDVALHLGTLAAVLWYYRGVWLGILTGAARSPRGPEGRSLALLVLATIPACVAGLLLEDAADTAFRDPRRIAYCLIAFSFVMILADRRRGASAWRDGGWRTALLVGLAQCLALMPGVSRSGATISAGLLLGLAATEAAELSFLMSAPIVAAAAILKLRHLAPAMVDGPFIAAIAVSGLSGLAAVSGLIRFLPRSGLTPYAIYRIAFGALVLFVLS